MEPTNNSSSSTNTILIVVLLLIVVGLGVYWFSTQKGAAPASDDKKALDININAKLPAPSEGSGDAPAGGDTMTP